MGDDSSINMGPTYVHIHTHNVHTHAYMNTPHIRGKSKIKMTSDYLFSEKIKEIKIQSLQEEGWGGSPGAHGPHLGCVVDWIKPCSWGCEACSVEKKPVSTVFWLALVTISQWVPISTPTLNHILIAWNSNKSQQEAAISNYLAYFITFANVTSFSFPQQFWEVCIRWYF